MGRRWDDGDYVTADNVEGGRLVARHLLARGHRRIGLIRPEEPGNTALEDRVQGFLDLLEAAGVSLPVGWEIRTSTTLIEDGMEAADRLLDSPDRPTAIFVTTDREAMGVIHRLLERGIRIPEDIAVVGYDDIPFAACTQIPLTTIAIPMRRLGERSAEILFDRLDGVGSPERQHVLLPPELVIRASSP
jgi:LacI family transcriptional regulator